MKLRDTVIPSPTSSGLVLFDVTEGRLFSCNSTGRFLWERLSVAPETMAADLAKEYGIPMATAGRDVNAFLAVLAHHHLIEMAGAR